MASFHAWEYRVRRVALGPHVFGAELTGAGSHSPGDCRRVNVRPGSSTNCKSPRSSQTVDRSPEQEVAGRGFGIPRASQRAKTHGCPARIS